MLEAIEDLAVLLFFKSYYRRSFAMALT